MTDNLLFGISIGINIVFITMWALGYLKVKGDI